MMTIIIDCRIFRIAHKNALRGDYRSSAKVFLMNLVDILWSPISFKIDNPCCENHWTDGGSRPHLLLAYCSEVSHVWLT